MMMYIILAIVSYLIGSVLFAYVFGKLIYHKDVRDYGSHNPGSTNAFRAFGKKIGTLAFAFDFLKGAFATYLGYSLLGEKGMFLAALMVVIGHDYPVFMRFNGGKGIAASAGSLLVIDYRLLLVAVSVFLIVFLATRIVSISSMLAAVSGAIAGLFFVPSCYGKWVLVFLALMALWRHRSNIQRLLRGEEKKFSL